jgi:membrane protease YdiL (CAAX protease family)
MSETEPGEPVPVPTGPPARPPGPVPAGYVPREWIEQAQAARAAQAQAQAQPEAPPVAAVPPSPLPPPPPAAAPPWATAVAAPPYPPSAGYPAYPPNPAYPPYGQALPPPPTEEGNAPFLDTPQVPPQTKHQGWMWIVFAVAGFVAGQIGAVVFGLAAGAIAGKDAHQMQQIASASIPPEWYVVSTLLGLWIGFIGAPWLSSRTQGTRNFVRDLGLRFRLVDLVGIAIGVGGQICVAIMYAPFQHDIHDFNGPSQRLTGGSHGGGFIIIALATVVFAPAMEELFFRGLLLKGLVRVLTPLGAAGRARAVGVVLAVIIDGLLFGLAHGEWVQLAGLAFFGIVLATVSYRTGRLGMNMVAHATFNLVAIIAILSQGNGVIFH